jgi:hypothetical protein
MDIGGMLAVSGAAFITGFSKSGMPGIGILIPLLAAMAMPARVSTGFILPVLIEGDCIAVAYWRRKAAWRSLLRILPSAAVGIAGGYFLMGVLSDALFKPLLGGMILAIVGLDLARRAMKIELRAENRVLAIAAGVLAGTSACFSSPSSPWAALSASS